MTESRDNQGELSPLDIWNLEYGDFLDCRDDDNDDDDDSSHPQPAKWNDSLTSTYTLSSEEGVEVVIPLVVLPCPIISTTPSSQDDDDNPCVYIELERPLPQCTFVPTDMSTYMHWDDSSAAVETNNNNNNNNNNNDGNDCESTRTISTKGSFTEAYELDWSLDEKDDDQVGLLARRDKFSGRRQEALLPEKLSWRRRSWTKETTENYFSEGFIAVGDLPCVH